MIIKLLNWKINYVINIWREKRVINFQGYTHWRERRKGKKGRERKTMEAERKIPGIGDSGPFPPLLSITDRFVRRHGYREAFSKFPLPAARSEQREEHRKRDDYARPTARRTATTTGRLSTLGGKGVGAGFQFKVGRACRDFNVQNAYAKLFAPLW